MFFWIAAYGLIKKVWQNQRSIRARANRDRLMTVWSCHPRFIQTSAERSLLINAELTLGNAVHELDTKLHGNRAHLFQCRRYNWFEVAPQDCVVLKNKRCGELLIDDVFPSFDMRKARRILRIRKCQDLQIRSNQLRNWAIWNSGTLQRSICFRPDWMVSWSIMNTSRRAERHTDHGHSL